MQWSFTTIGILLLHLRTALVSAGVLEPRYYGQPYHCDNVYFSGIKMDEVVRDVRSASRSIQEYCKARGGLMDCKEFTQLLEYYSGPPFTMSYLLWPLSPTTNKYEEAVLDKNLKVFSVIIKNQDGVRECRTVENVVQRHYPSNFSCKGKIFGYNYLVAATMAACPRTIGIAKGKFPARFDGPNFISHGKQRYIYPIIENKPYTEGEGRRERPYHLDYSGNLLTLCVEPGKYRLVMNSACKLVGVVMIDAKSNYEECDMLNFSISGFSK